MKYSKHEIINLKSNNAYNEKWVQNIIADDPSILGLGDLELKDSERTQLTGGRLDLLLRDPETYRRYEVEIQLGKVDESHIIRTIEYWDYERRKFPQYDHCAVIIAENITSRFLNVISLFNGNIPIIAIQMKAVKIGDKMSLIFTKVLDELVYGIEEDDIQEIVDRNYWNKKADTKYLELMDNILQEISSKYPGFVANYNKHYIGLSIEGISKNFIYFKPKKSSLLLVAKHEADDELSKLLDESNLDVLPLNPRFREYKIRLKEQDYGINRDAIFFLIDKAYESYMY